MFIISPGYCIGNKINLFSKPAGQSLGLGGLTKEFFVVAWTIVRQDFITAVQYFYSRFMCNDPLPEYFTFEDNG